MEDGILASDHVHLYRQLELPNHAVLSREQSLYAKDDNHGTPLR
jgi:hypothetical protein